MTREEQRKVKRFIRKTKERAKVAFVAIYFVGALALVGHIEHHYTIGAKVTELDGYTYTVVDEAGYEWKFTDDTLFPVGTKVKLKMFTNCTHNSRVDDEIVKVKPVK